MRARFDNADGALVPGLYARVKVGGSAPHEALLVDDAAINTSKKFVFVVDQQGRVSYREVQQGMQHGNRRVIVSGLRRRSRDRERHAARAPGEQVKPHMVPMTGGDAPSAPLAGNAKPAARRRRIRKRLAASHPRSTRQSNP